MSDELERASAEVVPKGSSVIPPAGSKRLTSSTLTVMLTPDRFQGARHPSPTHSLPTIVNPREGPRPLGHLQVLPGTSRELRPTLPGGPATRTRLKTARFKLFSYSVLFFLRHLLVVTRASQIGHWLILALLVLTYADTHMGVGLCCWWESKNSHCTLLTFFKIFSSFPPFPFPLPSRELYNVCIMYLLRRCGLF